MIIRDELGNPALNTVHCADALKLCGNLPAQSVDLILTDVPYGVTACAWDKRPDLDQMWAAFKRVIKPRGAIVMTASQPFTSMLVCSNLEMFRYEWVWNKVQPVGHLNAKVMPLQVHESVLIFSNHTPNYRPQMTPRLQVRIDKPRDRNYSSIGKQAYGSYQAIGGQWSEFYPKSILTISNANQADKQHPTQKPVALFEYLIRTYTQPGDLVLDPYMGSGTTALAARNTGRRWICGDTSQEYCNIGRERLRLPFEAHHVVAKNDVTDLPLFAALST